MEGYDTARDGTWCSDASGRHRICRQPVDLVCYSERDDEYYLRWEEDPEHPQMAAVPGRMMETATDAVVARRLSDLGLELEDAVDSPKEITRFLRRRAQEIRAG